MNLLDRLLEHDNWTTQQLLQQCAALSAEAWDQSFDIGHAGLRETVLHMIGNVEVWTDLMMGRDVRLGRKVSPHHSLADYFEQRWTLAYGEFASFARSIERTNRLDALWLDTLDSPPAAKTYGGAILHIITHNGQHRSEMQHIMQRLGIHDVIEGDLLGWEMHHRQSQAVPQLRLL